MPADTSPPIVTTHHEIPGSAASWPATAAGWFGAAILLLTFGVQAYWAGGGGAGAQFHQPWAAAAVATTCTLGAAVLLLARIGVLLVPLPRWLLRAGPWMLSALFAVLAATHFVALARHRSGDWQIDLQGPLLLLLAGLCLVVASDERPGVHARPVD